MRADKFERIYAEHRDRLFAFLVYRTGDRALAEDLVGDVFERALRAHARFDPRRGSESTWLYAIALNRLRDHYRRAQVERSALERFFVESPSGSILPTTGLPTAIWSCGRSSCSTSRIARSSRLRFGADLTAPQIAKVTHQPLTTVEGGSIAPYVGCAPRWSPRRCRPRTQWRNVAPAARRRSERRRPVTALGGAARRER